MSDMSQEDPFKTPPWMWTVRPSPFHAGAAARSQTNEWERWGSYTCATVYTDWQEEHHALRRQAGLVDLSPLRKFRLSGQGARALVGRLVTRDLSLVRTGESCLALMCDRKGHVIDRVQVLRIGDSEYHLYTEGISITWLLDAAAGLQDVTVDDVTDDFGLLGLYGPRAGYVLGDMLRAAGVKEVSLPPAGSALTVKVGKRSLSILRCSRLGEEGFDLRVKPRDALFLWERLMRVGQGAGLRPVGRRAQDVCRIEAGEPRLGTDFIGAHAALHGNRPRTPFELGLEELVDLDASHFNGRAALVRAAKAGRRTVFAGLVIEGTEPVTGAELFRDGRLTGIVTSSVWSPVLGKVVALATLACGHIDVGTELTFSHERFVELEPRHVEGRAVVEKLPFYGAASPAVAAYSGAGEGPLGAGPAPEGKAETATE